METILRYPDRRLRQPAAALEQFDDALRAQAWSLHRTMLAAQGVGITAPHVGVPQRLVVIQLDPALPPHFYVNPVVTWASPQTARHQEGSVSMPGVTEEVERPARVTVRYQDLDGGPHEITADGFLATCLQHEIDQLDGIFWLDRLSRLKRDRVVKRYEKLGRLHG